MTQQAVGSGALPVEPRRAPARESAAQPDRRDFWVWVWASIRPIVGWALAALGALALFLGWLGVSGQALTAKQIPYLVSGGLVGIALIVMAGVFLATEDWRRQIVRLEDVERKLDELHLLLTTDLPLDADTDLLPLSGRSVAGRTPEASRRTGVEQARDELVALPTGTVYHRSGCSLITGKSAAKAVDAGIIGARGLAPCRVCDPPVPVR